MESRTCTASAHAATSTHSPPPESLWLDFRQAKATSTRSPPPELVAEACRHARTPPGREIALRRVLGDRGLRVEVCDAGDGMPRPRGTLPEDESGRGLALAAALSDTWGAYPRPCGTGKTVRFELCPSDPDGRR
ncbi:ATP-binding protein [Streptomyces fenghuangensis]|uniref:ATP-binding protein n=1 Tax=Streptomyces sp. ICN903 TaxID=2964654 RepID=UPI0027E45751|nr:ATP-binding protein [Streptomyces sp. ICN903]